MKTKKISISNPSTTKMANDFSVLTLAAFLVLTGGGSPASATALRIANTGKNTEAQPTYRLDWDATSNSTYLVQSATSLAPDSTWSTLDTVFVPDKVGTYQLQVVATDSTGLSSAPAMFYRLILPQPVILSVEPAIVPPGVPVDFYVLGQCFPTNVVLQINGVTQGGAAVVSSSLATVPGFVPDVVGTYQVSLVVSGLVVSAFSVVCADPLANPELVLQGPPTIEPPASPQAAALLSFWLSKRGYDYYKAQSDMNAAGLHQNPYYIDNQNAGQMPGGHGRDRIIGGGGLVDAVRENDNVVFDTQDGKKGLNAVNVKLSRMAGGGADEGDGGGLQSDIIIKPPPHCPSPSIGGPYLGSRLLVQPFSGEVQACAVDLAIPGRELDFVWARTYKSRPTGNNVNWIFGYDIHCAQNSSGGMDVYDGTGRKDTFTLGTNGTYTCPEFFREGTVSNNTFTLTFADTGRWVFNPFDGTASAGKGRQIITRNGSTMTLGYDTSGRLAQVVDDLNRTNTMAYDTSGRLASVTDFSGRTVRYVYDGFGDLVAVISPPVTGTPNGNDFPGGKTNRYTYTSGYPFAQNRQNHLLLACVDALGQTNGQFTYGLSTADPTNYLRCVAAQEGSNPAFTYSWSLKQHPSGSQAQLNNPSYLKCIANDPVGNVSECFFDARGRCVIERDFTGRATPGVPVTDTLNRPTGQLRSTDPAYYETAWSWNNDSLCNKVLIFGGQQMQYVYQSDFDPATPARKRADCRVVREIASSPVDLNGDGIPDVTSRAWYYTYDPRFGSAKAGVYTATVSVRPNMTYNWRQGNYPKRDYCVQYRESDLQFATKGTGANNGIADAVTFGREKLKATTKTQGDFNLSNRRKGWDGTIKGLVVPNGNGMAITTKGTGAVGMTSSPNKVNVTAGEQCDNGLGNNEDFVTSATDPRGNVTTGTYNATGNRIKVQFHWDRSSSADADFAYDTHGQLTAITNAPDANGHRSVDTFAYAQGQLTQCVVDAGGLALTENYEYDARGNLTRCVDPRGNDCLFTYNALDQCVRAQSPVNISARSATDFAYDANDNLVTCTTQLRDAADNLLATPVDRASYDSLNQLTELALAIDATHALTNRFVYDGNGQCVQALGPDAVSGADPHQTVAYAYDERGLLFQTITAPGGPLQFTTQCDYDANGNPTRVSAGLEGTPSVTTLEYNGFGGFGSWRGGRFEESVRTENVSSRLRSGVVAISKITDPMGNVTTFNYDANDNLKVVRHFGETNDVPGTNGNVRLAESRFDYDGLNRCFRTHDLFFNPATQSAIGSGDAVSSCVLAPNGECVSVTDSLGRTTSFAYDTANRLSSATDARGNISVSVRDAMGNATAITRTELPDGGGGPQVFTTTYAYDHLNRCVSASDNVGNTSTCAYDSLNRVVRETNPNGNDTTYAYDLLGDCLASTDYAGSSASTTPTVLRTSHATYDTSARCLTSTDPNGNPASYAYDSLGDCTTVVNADGTRVQKKWLPANFRTIETDPNGTTVTNIYDLCDRLVHRDIAARGAAVASTTFETFAYDGCDRLVLANNNISQLTFSYDSFGDGTGSSQDGLAQSATYDSEGNPLSLTYPGGRVVTYAYDALDQVTNVSTTANGVAHPQLARFAYAGPGRLAGIACDNGISTRVTWNGLVNPANSAGDYGWQEVSRVRDGTVASPSLVCDVTGTYSRTQSKLTRSDAGRSSLTLTYDALEQLVESTNSVAASDTMYALDAAGNRSHVITNGVLMTPDYALSSALPPGDFQMNRYTTTPFGSQSYDANGNLIVRATAASPTFYHYDYADRLVEVDGLSSLGTLAPVATFTYDALGNRISKTTYPGVPAASVTTQYVQKGAGIRNGLFLHLPHASILEERVGTSVSRAFCEMTAFTGTGVAQYYHCDDLGNVLALTDAGGNVLERYAYNDYGQPQFLDASGSPLVGIDGQPVTSSPLGNPFLFHGLEWDGETGLHNNSGGNYFDPQTGRLIAPRNIQPYRLRVAGPTTFGGNNPWSPNSPPPPVTYLGPNGERKKEYVGHVSLLK